VTRRPEKSRAYAIWLATKISGGATQISSVIEFAITKKRQSVNTRLALFHAEKFSYRETQ
jgi:hypothetical protein